MALQSEKRILLVDDEPTLRTLIAGHLARDYRVSVSGSASEALGRLEESSYDLILVDTHMPEMSGPKLIESARFRNPFIKGALMTAQSMDTCVSYSLKHGVGNIISKTIPFDFGELDRVVRGLLTEEVFGLERYLEEGTPIRRFTVRFSRDMGRVRERILRSPEVRGWPEHRMLVLKLALDEAISNAVYHGNRIPKGDEFNLREYQQVEVSFGCDSEKVGLSVTDQTGSLSRETILEKLDRCMNRANDFLFQESGRGFHIIRAMVDRLIVNIRKNRRTELVMLVYPRRREIGHRPILINELS